jgi:hypothetical protein
LDKIFNMARTVCRPARFAVQILHERREATRLISSSMLPQKRMKRTGSHNPPARQ